MRILVCTMGTDSDIVFNAMRIHKYNKLTLIIEKNSLGCQGYKDILAWETINPNKLETNTVNPEDFIECYEVVKNIIVTNIFEELILDISGGNKLLAMATIICAFNYGIPVYQFQAGRHIRLPVMRHLPIWKRVTDNQVEIIRLIDKKISLNVLGTKMEKRGISFDKLKMELLDLTQL